MLKLAIYIYSSYLFERQRDRQKKVSQSSGLLHKCQQQLGLDQTEARS